MIRRHAKKLYMGLAVLSCVLLPAKGLGTTVEECRQRWGHDDCLLLACVCDEVIDDGVFEYYEDGDCSCIRPSGEVYCSLQYNECRYFPSEIVAPDDDPDPLDGPTTSAPGQVVEPVEGGSGLPGPVMGGPGQGSVVERETGDDTGVFNQGEVFQSAELGSWFHPDQYGHGEEFQMDAFLSDAPLDYLEALLDLQASGKVRADIPVAYYYAMKLGEDCNENGIPDAFDIEDGTSLDLNENRTPDECENNGSGGSDDLSPSKHTDEHDGDDHDFDDGTFTKPEDSSETDSDGVTDDNAEEASHIDPAGTNETDSSDENKSNTAQGPSSPCGTGVLLPVAMLSLCWMFVGTGRIRRQQIHTHNQRSNSNSI